MNTTFACAPRRPSVAAAVTAVMLYIAVVNGIQLSAGVPYAEWFKTAGNAWRMAVLPLAAGSALLLVAVRAAGWSHLWRDPVRLQTPGVMRAALVFWWLAIAIRLAGVQWDTVPLNLLAAVIVSGVLVGFAEETLFRGIFLRGLRERGRPEASAALWAAAAFGLFHLPNVFMGAGWIGLFQVVLAALSGSLLYAFRRRYGTIWPAMVAHGAWDISTFLAGSAASPWLADATLPLLAIQIALGLAVCASLLRHDRQTRVLPASGP
jgi:hypothetical protein